MLARLFEKATLSCAHYPTKPLSLLLVKVDRRAYAGVDCSAKTAILRRCCKARISLAGC